MPTVVRPFTDNEVCERTYQGGKETAYRDAAVLTSTRNPWKPETKFGIEWQRGYDNALAEMELLA